MIGLLYSEHPVSLEGNPTTVDVQEIDLHRLPTDRFQDVLDSWRGGNVSLGVILDHRWFVVRTREDYIIGWFTGDTIHPHGTEPADLKAFPAVILGEAE